MLPPTAFIAFLQNHDQVGNRAFGDRISSRHGPEALRAAAACYLLLPQAPMLFMGEEWHASQPFLFFSDFGPYLADAVSSGRREEFARFPGFQDPVERERIPDPQAESTFSASKLCWDDLSTGLHRDWLEWYRRILAARRKSIVPLIPGIRDSGKSAVVGDGAVLIRWGQLVLAANLSGTPVSGFPVLSGSPIWMEGSVRNQGTTLNAWTVIWQSGSRS